MAAAVRAHESGAAVTVLDDNATAGGQIWRGGESTASGQAARWFAAMRRIRLISSTTVVAVDAGSRTVLIETPDGPQELGFEKLVIATGSREIFLPFPGWTLPGITGVGALQALVKSGMPIRGKRVVIAGSGPLLLAAGDFLRKHGADVRIIAEQASGSSVTAFLLRIAAHPGKLLQAARLRVALAGSAYRTSCWIESAEGDVQVRQVHLRSGDKTWTADCDYAAVAWGLHPNTELAALLGCETGEHGVRTSELQQSSIDDVYCAGECTGIGGADLSLVEGQIAGYAAGGDTARARRLCSERERHRRFAAALKAAFRLRPEVKCLSRPDTIVCRCEDVRFEQLEPFSSFRAAKLHARCGMGPCQGRICGTAAMHLFGWTTGSVRPPVLPASLATLAGVAKQGETTTT
jgi:NADPH-dependent 2,4-dienoyl-CoA reductase/sulfur reductase-like enzyme